MLTIGTFLLEKVFGEKKTPKKRGVAFRPPPISPNLVMVIRLASPQKHVGSSTGSFTEVTFMTSKLDSVWLRNKPITDPF